MLKFQRSILFALNRLGETRRRDRYGTKHIYGGTVPPHVKAKRRARGKVAKASRKANRP